MVLVGGFVWGLCVGHVLSNSVEVLVDVLGDRLDLSVQVFLNVKHVVLVILSDEVDS